MPAMFFALLGNAGRYLAAAAFWIMMRPGGWFVLVVAALVWAQMP